MTNPKYGSAETMESIAYYRGALQSSQKTNIVLSIVLVNRLAERGQRPAPKKIGRNQKAKGKP